MNYANMIEEKNLKKTFIIATLVSTVINCFGSAQGLYDRLQQRKVDKKQDSEIKALQEEIKKKDTAIKESNSRRGSVKGSVRGDSPEGRELQRSLARSGAEIQNAYNSDYDRLGKRFAMGDIIAQNELQAQIIQLQQTVIQILEEAVYTGKQPSRADMITLFKASEAAREGSIRSLNSQYQRLLDKAPMRRALPPAPSAQEVSPLYCRYSFALQDDINRPLSGAFASGGDCRCDACGTVIPIEPGRAFQIYKDDPNTRTGERPYHILNRFMIKSHRANGEFACVLCSRFRKVDTIWEDVRSFAKHVSRAHDAVELSKEVDIKEVD